MSNGCGRGQVKKVGTEAVKRGRRKGWRDQVEQERAREGRMGLRMEKRGRNGPRRKERGHGGTEGGKEKPRKGRKCLMKEETVSYANLLQRSSA